MNKLIFLNQPISDQCDLTDCSVVPLSTCAMRDVMRRNLEYVKIEAFIDYEFAQRNKEAIWRSFNDLFNSADEMLADIYRISKLKTYGPFNANTLELRGTIENEIIHYRIFEQIIRSYHPEEIHLYSRDNNSGYSGISAIRFSSDVYKRILQKLSEKHKKTLICKIERMDGQRCEGGMRTNVVSAIKNFVKSNAIYHYLNVGTHEGGVDKIGDKAMFLQTGCGVYYYSQYFRDVVTGFDAAAVYQYAEDQESIPAAEIQFQNAMGMLQEPVRRLSELFGFDVSFIVSNTFDQYISEIPSMISRALSAEKYLSEMKPRYVFSTNMSGNELPLQMALCWDRDIVKVVKSHGDCIYDLTCWRGCELKPADLYFLETNEFAEYFRKNAEIVEKRVICDHDGVRMNARHRKRNIENLLLYVPWLFEPSLIFDVNYIPRPLFYRIQMQILNVLNELSDYKVVYKCLPVGLYDYHYPAPEEISNTYPRIALSTQPLRKELKRARYCLLDAPSTSMWESLNMRIPCHSLVWSRSHVRKSAVDLYRKYLTFFDSDVDVADKVRSILKENKFHTISDNEAASYKKRPDEITALFKNTLGRKARNPS